MALDPSIALGVRPLQLPDPLAQMAQVSQIQASQRQNEMAQMQLEQLKQDRLEMKDFQSQLEKSGGNPDLDLLAKTMLKSPKYFQQGVELTKKLKEQADFERAGKSLYPELFGTAPTAAPAAAPAGMPAPSLMRQPAVAPAAPTRDMLGTGMYGMQPTNALAPNVAQVAPVNALAASVAPTEPTGKTADQLRREIIMFSQSGDPRAKAMTDMLKAQLTELSKTAPDATLMKQLGYPLTKAGYQQFRDAQRPDRLLTPEEEAQKLRIAAAGRAPGTTVTMVAEKAEAGAFGKMLVDQFSDLSKSANLAIKTLPSIEANLSALNKGLDTGFGTDAKAAGARVLGALGVQNAEKFATDTQTFQSNAINAVLQKQLEQKGPQTESDARRIEQIGAELGKTKQANEFILATAREQLKRDVEQRNFYAKWKERTDSFKGAEDAWFAGEGGKSLFDRPGLKKYAVSTSASSQIPGQGAAAPAARTVLRTGTLNGRRVIQYSDGSTEYGN
jgi:hypothetical protein